jgi:hypothetical protein
MPKAAHRLLREENAKWQENQELCGGKDRKVMEQLGSDKHQHRTADALFSKTITR